MPKSPPPNGESLPKLPTAKHHLPKYCKPLYKSKKTVACRVLPRDKLVGMLKRVLEERYRNVVKLRYMWQVDPISFGNDEDDGIMMESGGDGDRSPVKLRISQFIPIGTLEEETEECSIEGCDENPPNGINQ